MSFLQWLCIRLRKVSKTTFISYTTFARICRSKSRLAAHPTTSSGLSRWILPVVQLASLRLLIRHLMFRLHITHSRICRRLHSSKTRVQTHLDSMLRTHFHSICNNRNIDHSCNGHNTHNLKLNRNRNMCNKHSLRIQMSPSSQAGLNRPTNGSGSFGNVAQRFL